MAFQLILGPAGSGKSTQLLEAMCHAEGAIYLVPGQFTFAAEKRLIHTCGLSGLGAPEVRSFHRLAHDLSQRFGVRDRALDGAAQRMAMTAICARLAPELTLFGGSARRSELTMLAQELIASFKQQRISPEDLARAADSATTPLLAMKLRDASLLYTQYEEFLAKGYLDGDDVLTRLAATIRSSDYLRGRLVCIDQFTTFTPQEYDCIAAILEQAQDVKIGLLQCEGDAFESVRRTRDRLTTLAYDSGAKVLAPILLPNAMQGAAQELCHLERECFRLKPTPYPNPTASVHLYNAKTPSSEVEHAARTILHLVRDEHVPFRSIAIMVRDLERFEPYITRIFPQYDIPVFLDKKESLASHPVALFALSALELICRRFTHENVFAYAKAPFSPLTAQETDLLENYCLAAGIRDRDWTVPEKWDMRRDVFVRREGAASEEYDLAEVNSAREKLMTPLVHLQQGFRVQHTARELCGVFYQFLTECRLAQKIEETTAFLQEIGELDRAARTRQVYNLLIGALDSLCDAMGDEPMTARLFADVLQGGLGAIEVGIIPSTLDQVCIGSIDRAKGHGARIVLILGANSGVFPAPQATGGIFTDRDREELLARGLELPPDGRMKSQSEQILVYSALTCAAEALYVSYSSAAATGEAMRPSSIVSLLWRIFPKLSFLDELLETQDAQITTAKATFQPFSRALCDCGDALPPLWQEVLTYYQSRPDWREMLDALWVARGYENTAKPLDRALVAQLYPDALTTSVSQLESYRRCPFSHFMRYTLRAKERRVLALSPADAGTFLHDLIDRFSVCMAEDGYTWRTIDDAYVAQKAGELTQALLGTINAHMLESARVRRQFARLERVAARSLSLIRTHICRGAFEPLGYEITFGDDGTFRPLTLHLPTGQTVTLRGRIDRADALETARGTFVRIVDYKSGQRDFSLSSVYQGLDLQLCVYLTALCEQGDYQSAGILYFRLDDPVVDLPPHSSEQEVRSALAQKLRLSGLILADDEVIDAMDHSIGAGEDFLPIRRTKTGFSDTGTATAAQFRALSAYVKHIVRDISGELLRGEIPIFPVKDACTYCTYSAACAFDPTVRGCVRREFSEQTDADLWRAMEEVTEHGMDAPAEERD